MSKTNFVSIANELNRLLDQTHVSLKALSEQQTSAHPKPGKWCKKEILGHLIDSASNNHQRFVRAALSGGLTFPGYAQAELVELERPREVTWSLLVELWASYNRYLAHVIADLPEDVADVECHIGENPPCTLLYLADDYVEHIKHHLNQILGTKFETSYVPEEKSSAVSK